VRAAFAAHGVSLYAVNRFPADGIVRFVQRDGLEVEGFENGRLISLWRPSDARAVKAALRSLR